MIKTPIEIRRMAIIQLYLKTTDSFTNDLANLEIKTSI